MREYCESLSKIFWVFTCNLFVEVVLDPQMDILAQQKQLLLLCWNYLLWNQNWLCKKKSIWQYYPVEQLSCQQELSCAEYFSMCSCSGDCRVAIWQSEAKPNLGKRTSTCSWVTRRSDGPLFFINWHMQPRCVTAHQIPKLCHCPKILVCTNMVQGIQYRFLNLVLSLLAHG